MEFSRRYLNRDLQLYPANFFVQNVMILPITCNRRYELLTPGGVWGEVPIVIRRPDYILNALTPNSVILVMNYLAHAYLSFNDADVLAGNMISDFVKGKMKYDYSISIQSGIQLHRSIDIFTDEHSATGKAKNFFRPVYRLYAGAFTDVVYDHFLALDEKQFEKNNGLKNFTQQTYSLLEKNSEVFPSQFQKLFPYMKAHDWLYNYQFKEGIRQSFGGLMRRAKYINETESAFEIFNDNYNALSDCYKEFFPDILDFARKKFDEICRDQTE